MAYMAIDLPDQPNGPTHLPMQLQDLLSLVKEDLGFQGELTQMCTVV